MRLQNIKNIQYVIKYTVFEDDPKLTMLKGKEQLKNSICSFLKIYRFDRSYAAKDREQISVNYFTNQDLLEIPQDMNDTGRIHASQWQCIFLFNKSNCNY